MLVNILKFLFRRVVGYVIHNPEILLMPEQRKDFDESDERYRVAETVVQGWRDDMEMRKYWEQDELRQNCKNYIYEDDDAEMNSIAANGVAEPYVEEENVEMIPLNDEDTAWKAYDGEYYEEDDSFDGHKYTCTSTDHMSSIIAEGVIEPREDDDNDEMDPI